MVLASWIRAPEFFVKIMLETNWSRRESVKSRLVTSAQHLCHMFAWHIIPQQVIAPAYGFKSQSDNICPELSLLGDLLECFKYLKFLAGQVIFVLFAPN